MKYITYIKPTTVTSEWCKDKLVAMYPGTKLKDWKRTAKEKDGNSYTRTFVGPAGQTVEAIEIDDEVTFMEMEAGLAPGSSVVKAVMGKPTRFVFVRTTSDEECISITPADYWHKHGRLDDEEVPAEVLAQYLPMCPVGHDTGFDAVAESLYEYLENGKVNYAKGLEILRAAGFEEVVLDQ